MIYTYHTKYGIEKSILFGKKSDRIYNGFLLAGVYSTLPMALILGTR